MLGSRFLDKGSVDFEKFSNFGKGDSGDPFSAVLTGRHLLLLDPENGKLVPNGSAFVYALHNG